MRILLTGGSACGKSSYAEALAARFSGARYYLATMRPYDDECVRKITRHQEQRREFRFTTIEKETDLGSVILPNRGIVLLECMCNWLANEMFDEVGNFRDPSEKMFAAIEHLAEQCEHLIVVTNEVGCDCMSFGEGTKRYIELLGRMNAILAAQFDTVLELVCGIPIVLKGEQL